MNDQELTNQIKDEVDKLNSLIQRAAENNIEVTFDTINNSTFGDNVERELLIVKVRKVL